VPRGHAVAVRARSRSISRRCSIDGHTLFPPTSRHLLGEDDGTFHRISTPQEERKTATSRPWESSALAGPATPLQRTRQGFPLRSCRASAYALARRLLMRLRMKEHVLRIRGSHLYQEWLVRRHFDATAGARFAARDEACSTGGGNRFASTWRPSAPASIRLPDVPSRVTPCSLRRYATSSEKTMQRSMSSRTGNSRASKPSQDMNHIHISGAGRW